jgi:hypothetical protein
MDEKQTVGYRGRGQKLAYVRRLLYMSEQEFADLRAAAQKLRMSFSAYIVSRAHAQAVKDLENQ